jgi:hypothetical protein
MRLHKVPDLLAGHIELRSTTTKKAAYRYTLSVDCSSRLVSIGMPLMMISSPKQAM